MKRHHSRRASFARNTASPQKWRPVCTGNVPGGPHLWLALGHTGRKGVVLGHMLNTSQHVITKKSHNVVSKCTILCWAAFTATLGRRLDTPGTEAEREVISQTQPSLWQGCNARETEDAPPRFSLHTPSLAVSQTCSPHCRHSARDLGLGQIQQTGSLRGSQSKKAASPSTLPLPPRSLSFCSHTHPFLGPRQVPTGPA